MENGTVKWFNPEKGFGFIVANNKDYFVHFKEIDANGFRSLNEGDEVSFNGADSAKGAVARNVKVTKAANA